MVSNKLGGVPGEAFCVCGKFHNDRGGFISGGVSNQHPSFGKERAMIHHEAILSEGYFVAGVAEANRRIEAVSWEGGKLIRTF